MKTDVTPTTRNENIDGPMFNAHAHCFKLDNVPDNFAKGLTGPLTIKLSTLKKKGVINWLVNKAPNLLGSDTDVLSRMSNFVKYANHETQQEIIDKVRTYYPGSTQFVMLSMDMDYMDGGAAPEPYPQQLQKLAQLMDQPIPHDPGKRTYRQVVHPFVFLDPRRLKADPTFWPEVAKPLLENGTCQGIKLYPALGYFPHDPALKEPFLWAAENEIPIMSHVLTSGAVYYRGPKEFSKHPIPQLGMELPGKKGKDFTVNFSHPINFECLLNPDIIGPYWNLSRSQAETMSNLKVCMGHFGGYSQWMKFLQDPWLPDENLLSHDMDTLSLNWWKSQSDEDNYSWFSTCLDLMRKYPNIYADVSYTLSFEECYPLLKVVLESDKNSTDQGPANNLRPIWNKTLFGTDFFVVSPEATEREFAIKLRGYLSEEFFNKIACHNPVSYLNNRCSPLQYGW